MNTPLFKGRFNFFLLRTRHNQSICIHIVLWGSCELHEVIISPILGTIPLEVTSLVTLDHHLCFKLSPPFEFMQFPLLLLLPLKTLKPSPLSPNFKSLNLVNFLDLKASWTSSKATVPTLPGSMVSLKFSKDLGNAYNKSKFLSSSLISSSIFTKSSRILYNSANYSMIVLVSIIQGQKHM